MGILDVLLWLWGGGWVIFILIAVSSFKSHYWSGDLNTVIGISAVMAFIGLIPAIIRLVKRFKMTDKDRELEEKKKADRKAERDKQKEIQLINAAYERGKLSLAEADVLLAELEGRKSLVDMMGYEAAMAASNKAGVEQRIKKHNEQANKRIVYNAAVGSAVGGLGGTVIGAATALNNLNAEKQQLTSEYAIADQQFQDALKRSVDRQNYNWHRENHFAKEKPNTTSAYDELEKIADLRKQGVLNQEEYEKLKKKYLERI